MYKKTECFSTNYLPSNTTHSPSSSLPFTQRNQFGVVHINVEWIKQKTPRMWGLMLICFYGLKIGATYLPLISFFPKKCYNISCLIMGYRRAFRNRILLSLSIINRLRLRPRLPSLVFVFILIPILLLNNNHLDVVPP